MKTRWLCELLTWLRGTGLVNKESGLGRRLFSTHESRCPTCRQEWAVEDRMIEQLRRTAASYRRLPPPNLSYRIQAQIRAATPPARPHSINLWIHRPRLAAAVLSFLLLLTGVTLWWHRQRQARLAPIEQMVLLGQTFYEIALPSSPTGLTKLLQPVQDSYRSQLQHWAVSVRQQAQTTLQSCLPQPELLGLPPLPPQQPQTQSSSP